MTITSPTYIPNNLYEVLVYNRSGELQYILQNWSRLEFTQRINSPWNHQITLEFGYDSPELAGIRTLQKDWIFIIYRTDPVTRVKTKVYEGFHITTVDQVRDNGGIIINLYGSGFTQLLQRRIVLPDTGAEYSTKSGNAESVIKGYVSDSMVGPTDTNRIFSGVSILASRGAGIVTTYAARYTNLLSVCETVSEQGNLDFGIYGGESIGTFTFDAVELWGTDHREGNAEGNVPVVFSIERDNMLVPILSTNSSSEKNYAYVGGSGEAEDRVIQEVYDSDSVNDGPWSRKEFFVEARQQSDTTGLSATGQAALQENRATQSLSFNIKQTDSTRWVRDWNLGDLITARYYSYNFDKQVAKIKVQVTTSGEDISVEFEDLRI